MSKRYTAESKGTTVMSGNHDLPASSSAPCVRANVLSRQSRRFVLWVAVRRGGHAPPNT